MNELKPEEATVNGVPVKDLSAASQQIFTKIISLKKEADELEKSLISKRAALEELANIIVEEVNQIKAAAETPAEVIEAVETPAE